MSDFQKLLTYFNGTAIVAFFKTPLVVFELGWANNLALYFKDLKSSVFVILALESVVWSFE